MSRYPAGSTEEDRAAIAMWRSIQMAIDGLEAEREKLVDSILLLRQKLKECEERNPHILPPRGS